MGISVWPLVAANDVAISLEDTKYKSYFGILLSVSSVGEDMTYAVFTENSSGKSYKFINRHEFTNIAAGKWPLKPNVNRDNLLEKHKIIWGYDERNRIAVPALDSLWKIRYKTLASQRGIQGWINGQFMPSAEQQLFLADSFKIGNINTDFITGEEVWKLLQSVQNQEWINYYKSLVD